MLKVISNVIAFTRLNKYLSDLFHLIENCCPTITAKTYVATRRYAICT